MSAPGFWSDSEQARATVDEVRQLKRWTEPFGALSGRTQDAIELAQLVAEDPDPEKRGVQAMHASLSHLSPRS